MNDYLFFVVCLFAGIVMVFEGGVIVLRKRTLEPLPSRVLYGLGALVVGKRKSRKLFLKPVSSRDLRQYATITLIFGVMIILSSFVFLFTVR